jgi:hypothetical protein
MANDHRFCNLQRHRHRHHRHCPCHHSIDARRVLSFSLLKFINSPVGKVGCFVVVCCLLAIAPWWKRTNQWFSRQKWGRESKPDNC